MSDLGDPLLQTWQLAWLHRVVTGGGGLWTSNAFHPAVDNFAFSDSLVGYLPLALFGDGQFDAVMRYNVAYVSAFALAFIGGYLLVRQLGGNWQAAAVAGVVFAWAPWRLLHTSHLNILSTGGIALALFALARGHGFSFRHGLQPDKAKPWWAFAGWLLAAWQISIGFATGIPFFYVMAGLGLVIAVVITRRRHRDLLIANGAGAAVFLAVTVTMMAPYLRVVERYEFTRTWDELVLRSPAPQSLWTASRMTWLWRDSLFNDTARFANPLQAENMLFPGMTVLLLALLGLVVSVWPRRVRIALGASALVITIFALGAGFFGGTFTYMPLWEWLPGWNSMRTPGRLILWTVLLLILLAAGAVTRLAQLLTGRRRMVVLVVVLLGVLLEAVPVRRHVTPPGIPADLKAVFAETREPVLVLPIDGQSEYRYLLWSTEGFPQMANGVSGNVPPSYVDLLRAGRAFPDSESMQVLDEYGIRKVVVFKEAAEESAYYSEVLTKPIAGLPVTKEDRGDLVVFTIRPPGSS